VLVNKMKNINKQETIEGFVERALKAYRARVSPQETSNMVTNALAVAYLTKTDLSHIDKGLLDFWADDNVRFRPLSPQSLHNFGILRKAVSTRYKFEDTWVACDLMKKYNSLKDLLTENKNKTWKGQGFLSRDISKEEYKSKRKVMRDSLTYFANMLTEIKDVGTEGVNEGHSRVPSLEKMQGFLREKVMPHLAKSGGYQEQLKSFEEHMNKAKEGEASLSPKNFSGQKDYATDKRMSIYRETLGNPPKYDRFLNGEQNPKVIEETVKQLEKQYEGMEIPRWHLDSINKTLYGAVELAQLLDYDYSSDTLPDRAENALLEYATREKKKIDDFITFLF
jgi:hypothetical protein